MGKSELKNNKNSFKESNFEKKFCFKRNNNGHEFTFRRCCTSILARRSRSIGLLPISPCQSSKFVSSRGTKHSFSISHHRWNFCLWPQIQGWSHYCCRYNGKLRKTFPISQFATSQQNQRNDSFG